MNTLEVIQLLEQHTDEHYREGLEKFGIPSVRALGVRMPTLRRLAKQIGSNQQLSLTLWEEDIHEAKHMAMMICDQNKLSQEELEHWASEAYSWDLCDHIGSITAKRTDAYEYATRWMMTETETIKRCGFVTLTCMVLNDKKATNESIEPYFEHIRSHAWDDRNLVKKAVNWLLRQIGKRNLHLNEKAIQVAEELKKHPDRAARWIASDALRELKSEAVQRRLLKKEEKARDV